MAAQRVVEKAKKIAAHMLEAAEGDIEFESGRFSVTGSPDWNVTIQDVAAAAYMANDLPEGMQPVLSEEFFFDPPNFTFPFGAHICVTEVDTETGFVKIRDYFGVDDCGPVINPAIVDGQIQGGIAQGIAQALYEEAVYDEEGNLTTGSMVDYLVPGAPELPNYTLERTVTPSSSNEMGVKGIGEAGTIGAPPAVINSIVDALSPYGITHIDMPASPWKVWQAIQDTQGQEAGTRDADRSVQVVERRIPRPPEPGGSQRSYYERERRHAVAPQAGPGESRPSELSGRQRAKSEREGSVDIEALMTEQLGSASGSTFYSARGQAIERLLRSVQGTQGFGDPDRFEPLVAMLFWQIFKASSSYRRALRRARASQAALHLPAETIVVPHGDEDNPRYDLMVFDPDRKRREWSSVPLRRVREKDLREGYLNWHSHRQAHLLQPAREEELHLLDSVDPDLAIEAYRAKPFGIVVGPPPHEELTSGGGPSSLSVHAHRPATAWGVSCNSSGEPTSPAGVAAKDQQGREGVTVCLHDLRRAFSYIEENVTQVDIGGLTGRVISHKPDYACDSCFVQLAPIPWHETASLEGPLQGPPKPGERATFEGITSAYGAVETFVKYCPPDLILPEVGNQAKFYTRDDTNRGDSGAVLVNDDGYILGFAFGRSPAGYYDPWSSWIWADIVFRAHGLYL